MAVARATLDMVALLEVNIVGYDDRGSHDEDEPRHGVNVHVQQDADEQQVIHVRSKNSDLVNQ